MKSHEAATPPAELDTEVPDKQGSGGFQLFTSLLHFRSGWFANHALHLTAPAVAELEVVGRPITHQLKTTT